MTRIGRYSVVRGGWMAHKVTGAMYVCAYCHGMTPYKFKVRDERSAYGDDIAYDLCETCATRVAIKADETSRARSRHRAQRAAAAWLGEGSAT